MVFESPTHSVATYQMCHFPSITKSAKAGVNCYVPERDMFTFMMGINTAFLQYLTILDDFTKISFKFNQTILILVLIVWGLMS